MLEELTGKKVVGVVPYLPLDLDDEDSSQTASQRPAQRGLVDIAVIRLPRISNFTDFNPWPVWSRFPALRGLCGQSGAASCDHSARHQRTPWRI